MTSDDPDDLRRCLVLAGYGDLVPDLDDDELRRLAAAIQAGWVPRVVDVIDLEDTHPHIEVDRGRRLTDAEET